MVKLIIIDEHFELRSININLNNEFEITEKHFILGVQEGNNFKVETQMTALEKALFYNNFLLTYLVDNEKLELNKPRVLVSDYPSIEIPPPPPPPPIMIMMQLLPVGSNLYPTIALALADNSASINLFVEDMATGIHNGLAVYNDLDGLNPYTEEILYRHIKNTNTVMRVDANNLLLIS